MVFIVVAWLGVALRELLYAFHIAKWMLSAPK